MPADGREANADTAAQARAAPPPFILLVLLTSASPFALNAIIPAMPGMADELEVPYAVIQLLLTLALVSFGTAQLVAGPLSDRFGRRPMVLGGLALFCLGTFLSALANSAELVILGRVIQASGGAVSFALARTIVHDTYDRASATSVISYMVMVMVLAPMIASIIGGDMAVHVGWRPIFLLVMTLGLYVLLLSILHLRETNRLAGSGRTLLTILRQARELFTIPLFWGYAGAASFASAMFFSFVGVAPYIVEKVMGRPQTDFGLYFLFMSVGYMGGNFASARLSRAIGPSQLIGLGVIVSALGVLLFWLLYDWVHPAAIFIPMMFMTFSNGVTLPSSTVGAMSVKEDLAGSASGVIGAIQMLVAAIMTAMVGVFESESRLAMTIALSTAWVLSALSWLMIRRNLAVGSGQ